ncbi:neuropeptide F receptor [Loa loa]|uniref:Neuropeptide F receptor n=1 Tax=Loa loa TaxID=7209 RepID=A0A1I7V7X4_LOALO|nr:neuropeptide F receptor [Loa loa]EFO19795.2 neuropeptide F receptor [Loa loa]
MPSIRMKDNCDEWRQIFTRIDSYFRDDIVLEGTNHASAQLGWCITVAYVVVILFGTFGNMLTIIAVLYNPQIRTTRNFFILNLALSDFFICTITAPITSYTVLYTFWPFGLAMCKITGSLLGFGIFLSTFSIAAIALDRYVVIIFPTKRKRQHNLALLLFSLIWIISITLALPLLITSDLNTVFDDDKCGISLKICHEKNEIWNLMPISKRAYTLAVLLTQYALPLISIVFAYSTIAMRMQIRMNSRLASSTFTANANNNERRKSVAGRQRRTHLLLICVVIVFAVAWLPLNVFHVLNTFGIVEFSVPLFAICHLIAMGSACLNPVSYAFFNQNFRQQFIMFYEAAIRKILQTFDWVTPARNKHDRVKYNRSANAVITTQHASTINAKFMGKCDDNEKPDEAKIDLNDH